MAYNLTPYWSPNNTTSKSSQTSSGNNMSVGTTAGLSNQSSVSRNQSSGANQQSSFSESGSYIPEYSQTPILEGIAKYSANMAPEVYQWGMTQFNKNQGNIDAMMRDATSYASPQRIQQEMGMAQAGVMQGAEQGRQNATRDLESFGIDPSSGRYAALDSANRTMAGAMAAGAGNQQRMATEAAGSAMKNQAMTASLQNNQVGYGAANAANQLLGTGMQLQYSPLGNRSVTGSQSSGTTSSLGETQSMGSSSNTGTNVSMGGTSSSSDSWGGTHPDPYAEGGYVPDELSKSDGQVVDDIPANLTAGEFIIPKDVVEWKGKEYFYKLMAQSRKLRASGGGEDKHVGYGAN